MIDNFKENSKNIRDYNSELLLRILIKSSTELNNSHNKEIFVDVNRKIDSKKINSINTIPRDNSNLERILSEIFVDKKILIQDNNDGSQTIFLS